MNTKSKSFLSLITSLSILFGVFFNLLSPAQKVDAASNNSANFTIMPVNPKSPAGFFELDYIPGTNLKLTYAISNRNSKDPQKFETTIISASTTNDGKISYTPIDHPKVDDLMLPRLVNEKKKIVEVGAGQTSVFELNIKIPKDLNGTVAGAIHVLRVDPEGDSSGAISFKNRFAMSIPIILNEKDGKKIYPKLKITNINIHQKDDVTEILTVVNNPDPVMFGEISIDAKILNSDQSKALKTTKVKNYEWAPKSTLSFPQTTDELKPGKYWSDLTISSGSKTYHLKKEFEIKAKPVSIITGIPQKNNFLWFIGILVLLLFGLIVLYLLARRHKKIDN